MTFTESSTVEQLILDTITRKRPAKHYRSGKLPPGS